ncbi:MAG: hypothetical protein AAGE86_09325 [Pseudomonadota bacterium]
MADRTPTPDTPERSSVIPAQAGIQFATPVAPHWTPACAGVTVGDEHG